MNSIIFIVGACIAVFMFKVFWEQTKAKSAQRKAIEATRRIEVVDGKRWSVVTVKRCIVRQKSTGRLGVVMGGGRELDPVMVHGKLTAFPRWLQIQYINKKTNTISGKVFWGSSDKWEVAHTEMVNEYTELSTR